MSGEHLLSAGALVSESASFELAVYQLPKCKQDPKRLVEKLLKEKYQELAWVNEFQKQPDRIQIRYRVEEDVQHNFAPPSLNSLQHFANGLSNEQKLALQSSKQAIILQFAYPKSSVWIAVRTANSLLEDIAIRSSGLVWDEETRQVFTAEYWHSKRLDSWTETVPYLPDQFKIDVYSNGDYDRAISLGMAKFGLPDIVVEQVPKSSFNQVGNLIDGLAQALAEGNLVKSGGQFRLDLHSLKSSKAREKIGPIKHNGTGIACLTLSEAKKEEGDPNNRLIKITADRYSGLDPLAQQERMVSSLFGSSDSVHFLKENEELLAESYKAKAKLPQLQKAFNEGLKPGEYITVKAPFTTDDGSREWMWVEVYKWKDNQIRGLLENEPLNVSHLHAGQTVTVKEEDLFDYIHYFPDGHKEGNTTSLIIERMNRATTDKSVDIPVEVPCRND